MRKRARQRRGGHSFALWSLLRTAAGDRAIVLTKRGVIHKVNEPATRLLERDETELQGRRLGADVLGNRMPSTKAKWQLRLRRPCGQWKNVQVCRQSVPFGKQWELYCIDPCTVGREDQQDLRLRLDSLDFALNSMVQGLAMFDADFRTIVTNTRYAEIYGLALKQVLPGTLLRDHIYHHIATGLHPGSTAEDVLARIYERATRDEVSYMTDQMGNGRIIAITIRPVPGGGFVSTHTDVTEREELRNRLDVALNNMMQGLAMFDRDFRIIVANRLYAELYGLPVEHVRPGTPLRQIVEHRLAHGHHPGATVDEVLDKLVSRTHDGAHEYVNDLADGRSIAVSVRCLNDGCTVTTHRDITEKRKSEAKISHMALHDGLTGLANRVLLKDRLEGALACVAPGSMVALHLLDLDRFKQVNDSLGHPAGDELLRQVAARLCLLVRTTDTIARMGGDEFAIVQEGITEASDAVSLAHRIIESISQPYDLAGQQAVIGTSDGIVLGLSNAQSSEELMRQADLALYRAKNEGRGALCFFEPHMDVEMQARRLSECELRRAIVGGQFELHYQPLVTVEAGEIASVEALVRWRHPTKGLLLPDTFLPLAEEIGLIAPLGEWIIRTACASAARWPRDTRVAVNLSPIQLHCDQLPSMVADALAGSGLSPERLEIEVTEAALLTRGEITLDVLYRLRELGVRIVLDDFGDGWSSLSRLQCFPFDKLKIDRSYISDIADNTSSIHLVRAMVTLAGALGMTSTAEGVETDDQLALVRAGGCTEAQGYLFSRALSGNEIDKLLIRAEVFARAACAPSRV
jgi:diguanylate cyclase (GGDEF)-like protein